MQHPIFPYYHQEPPFLTLSQLSKPPPLTSYVKAKKNFTLAMAPNHNKLLQWQNQIKTSLILLVALIDPELKGLAFSNLAKVAPLLSSHKIRRKSRIILGIFPESGTQWMITSRICGRLKTNLLHHFQVWLVFLCHSPVTFNEAQ